MAGPPVTALLTTDTIHMLHEFKVVNRKMEIFSVKIFSRLFPGDFARMGLDKPRGGIARTSGGAGSACPFDPAAGGEEGIGSGEGEAEGSVSVGG
jgi:hypothetical protein